MTCCNPSSTFSTTSNSYLIVGGEVNTHSLTIASGQSIVTGDMLMRDATTGKLSKLTAGNEAKAFAIAAYNVDATLADTKAEVYVEGRFDQGAVNLNGADLDKTKAFLSSDIQLVKRY